jgi:hypothetical protein
VNRLNPSPRACLAIRGLRQLYQKQIGYTTKAKKTSDTKEQTLESASTRPPALPAIRSVEACELVKRLDVERLQALASSTRSPPEGRRRFTRPLPAIDPPPGPADSIRPPTATRSDREKLPASLSGA